MNVSFFLSLTHTHSLTYSLTLIQQTNTRIENNNIHVYLTNVGSVWRICVQSPTMAVRYISPTLHLTHRVKYLIIMTITTTQHSFTGQLVVVGWLLVAASTVATHKNKTITWATYFPIKYGLDKRNCHLTKGDYFLRQSRITFNRGINNNQCFVMLRQSRPVRSQDL